MNKKSVEEIDVKDKKVLVRVDFNVPLSSKDPAEKIEVTDDIRIRAALPTINYLLDQGAAVILASHLGRPKSPEDKHLTMDPVAERLGELVDAPVKKVDEVVGPEAQAAAEALEPGEILLLENTRFHAGEKKNDPELAQKLAAMADVYVNDAFGSAHRAHASTEGAARAMREKGGPAVAGYLMEKEIQALGKAAQDPPHPYVAIMGGAKISDKIKLIDNLLQKADKILIGGGMANTFLAAKKYEMGESLVEEEAVAEAERLLRTAGARLVLPVDVVVVDEISADAETSVVGVENIPASKIAVDIGPETVENFGREVQNAKLVVWNGPMGIFEIDKFAHGTDYLAKILADLAEEGTEVVIGGGDSAAAVQKAGLKEKMTHVSTGGGASLEMLQGETLPGIAILDDK